VSGRRGAPSSQEQPVSRLFMSQYPYGWGLDMPVDPMSKPKSEKMVKQVKRGEFTCDSSGLDRSSSVPMSNG
jgi:hypothetical protein